MGRNDAGYSVVQQATGTRHHHDVTAAHEHGGGCVLPFSPAQQEDRRLPEAETKESLRSEYIYAVELFLISIVFSLQYININKMLPKVTKPSPKRHKRRRMIELRFVHVDAERGIGAIVVQDSRLRFKAGKTASRCYFVGQRVEVLRERSAVIRRIVLHGEEKKKKQNKTKTRHVGEISVSVHFHCCCSSPGVSVLQRQGKNKTEVLIKIRRLLPEIWRY